MGAQQNNAPLNIGLSPEAGLSPAKEIADPTGFINTTSDFKIADLIGKKVILVDFWTYSCINCIRTLPYLTAWYAKYHDQGLEIVGIHTPEFEFEKDINNVKTALEKNGIKYPVVLDSNYGTWNAYGNQYWPHEYLIDLAGNIAHDKIGEGNYDETEMEIRKLLKLPDAPVVLPITQVEASSPETYFGSDRGDPNANYLIGNWNLTNEYAEGTGSIKYRYTAKGVYFVAGISGKEPVEIEVLRDSKPLEKSAAGTDIYFRDGKSFVRVNETRLYRIIDDKQAGEHILELIISKPGLRAYTFTFG